MNAIEKRTAAKDILLAELSDTLSRLNALQVEDHEFSCHVMVEDDDFCVNVAIVAKQNTDTKVAPAYDAEAKHEEYLAEKARKAAEAVEKAAAKAAKEAAKASKPKRAKKDAEPSVDGFAD